MIQTYLADPVQAHPEILAEHGNNLKYTTLGFPAFEKCGTNHNVTCNSRNSRLSLPQSSANFVASVVQMNPGQISRLREPVNL